MTPAQIERFGKLLGPAGCVLTLWRYDEAFMGNASTQTALRNLRGFLDGLPAPTCRRST